MSISTLTADRISPFGQISARIYTSHTLPFRHIPLKSIRPLPPTPSAHIELGDISKPLPTLPPITSLPPLAMPSISIIPATPLPLTPTSPAPLYSQPCSPTEASLGAIPMSPRSSRPRMAPLRVCTSPEVLQRPISGSPRSGSLTPTCGSPTKYTGSLTSGLSPSSPLLPDLPQAPSPTTARRRRLNKLRRHLGEAVPPELVYSPRSRSLSLTIGVPLERSDSGSSLVFEKQENLREKETWSRAYDTDFGSVGNERRRKESRTDASSLVESDVTDDDDDTSVDSGAGSEEYRWVVSRAPRLHVSSPTPGANPRRSGQRFSKRWYREQGGHRWEGNDYQDLLKQLRSL